MGADGTCGPLDVGARRIRAGERDVLGDSAGKEESLLRHDSELAPQRALLYVAHVVAVDRDAPFT